MPKYQNAYREDLDKPEDETAQEAPEERAENPEEDTFKKRYGDLRRHSQQREAQLQQQIDDLKDQVQQAAQKQIKLPKTEEELKAWANKYPDVAAVMDTYAQMRANEALEKGSKELERVRKLEKKIYRDKAEAELKRLHPDFDEIKADPKFHEWVSQQSSWVQDSLYRNSTDAKAAADAIDLYKAKTKRKSPRTSGAAESVGRSSGAAPKDKGRARFSESSVQKMSSREYEANEAAISEAIRKGEFDYDISGAAR